MLISVPGNFWVIIQKSSLWLINLLSVFSSQCLPYLGFASIRHSDITPIWFELVTIFAIGWLSIEHMESNMRMILFVCVSFVLSLSLTFFGLRANTPDLWENTCLVMLAEAFLTNDARWMVPEPGNARWHDWLAWIYSTCLHEILTFWFALPITYDLWWTRKNPTESFCFEGPYYSTLIHEKASYFHMTGLLLCPVNAYSLCMTA